MGLKIFAFILILFVAEITFLSTKEPKILQVSKKDINYSNVEFIGLQGHSITQDGVLEHITASKAQKYKDHDTLYDINTTFFEGNIAHSISAQKARFQDDNLYLSGNVKYENNQTMQLKSSKLEYNVKTKIAKGPTAFELTSSKGIATGESFVYDMKEQALKGEKMHYRFEVDE